MPRGKPLWKPLTTKQAEYLALSRCLIFSLYLLSAAPVSRSAFCVLVHNVSMSKPKIAFICVHNSCRSQIAEAFGKVLAADVFESYSAGTETKPQINQDAVRLMKELYGIDMEKTQYSKLISAIPKPDIAISMGCNVSCPFIGRPFDENWGLDDPTGKSDDEFKAVMEQIRQNVLTLKSKLCDGSSF